MRVSTRRIVHLISRPLAISAVALLALAAPSDASAGQPASRARSKSADSAAQKSQAAPAKRDTRLPKSLIDTADGPIDPDLGVQIAPRTYGTTIGGSSYTVTVTGFGSSASTAGGSKSAGKGNGRGSMTNAPFYYELTLNAGTGYLEKYLLQFPPNYRTAGPRPLLTVFHKFGVSEKDAVINTSYFQEAWNRGWYAIAPLGAAQVHFSSIESQINTEAVLDWTLANGNVDPNRIFAVGFSMGGGAAMNYAARHLDPSKAMFAAVVDHSGTVSVADAYANDPPIKWMIDYWFGDTTAGSADPWKMNRSSVITIDAAGPNVEPQNSLACNLLHVAMRIVRASNDSIPYLSAQADLLDQHLKGLGVQGGGRYGYYVLPYTGHSWDMLDEKATCDWLGQQTLLLPTEGHTMADRDAVYFDLTVAQDAPNAFTPFDWKFDGASNEFSLTNTSNLREVSFDLANVSLDAQQTLRVSVSTADGLADEVRIQGYPGYPLAVLRDSLPETSWSYDPLTQELVVHEYDGGAHTWEFLP